MSTLDPFRGLRPPVAPAELEERALRAAGQATPVAAPSVWQRLWESRGARLCWATAVASLLIAHAVLSLGGSPPPVTQTPVFAVTAAVSELGLEPVVTVARIDPDALDGL